MDAKELRIGNLVNFRDENHLFEILEVHQTGLRVKNDEQETWIEFDCFDKIELTQRIMLDFGFFIQKGIFGYEYHLNRFVIYTSEDNNLCFCWDNNSKTIKYVHQLQNLYFALTGQELILK